ncbi:hypothetical protein FSP39_022710 [Pinctada imbricata]|uniref:TTF-type domain-containing protein n=1 Tax=Pinctada imbricata TaxID=66713 RepID=A0AA89BY20_PINIB|nr:hypothetical protein FSP39_022710 [Pinctada imbricata]
MLNHPIYSIYPSFPHVAVNRNVLHQEIRPFSDDSNNQVVGSTLYIMWSHTVNSGQNNWTPNHFVACFPILSTDSDENEPATKKSKSDGIDSSGDSQTKFDNPKENIASDEQEYKETKTKKSDEDEDKEHFDDPKIDRYDLGKIVNGTVKLNVMSSADKINYIKNQPLPEVIGKLNTGRTQTKSGHKKTLSFQASWMVQFPWLTFSKLLNGGLCKFCVLFPQSNFQHQDTFVTSPFISYKKALGKKSSLLKHQSSEHHKNAKMYYQTLLASTESPSTSLPYRFNKQNQANFDCNKKVLESIVDAVIFCGKQNIPLRGHRDDSTSDASNKGNFLAILKLIGRHDELLSSHLASAKKNASYTSKTIQNEIIKIIGDKVISNILETLHEMKCLQYMVNPSLHEETNEDWSWDRQSKITAQGLLTSLTSFPILITFVFAKYVIDTIKPLTVKLQKRDNDIAKANKLIVDHVSRVKEMRENVDDEFESCFLDAKKIADDIEMEVTIPRTCGKQKHRVNVSSNDPAEYYKLAVAIPFLDYFLQELSSRFLKEDQVAYSLCSLLPENIVCFSDDELSKLASGLEFWNDDLPCLSKRDFVRELTEWRRQCKTPAEKTSDIPQDLLGLFNIVDEDTYPNVKRLLHIACVLPITTCEAERSFSGLRRIKSYLRSTMHEERLTGLALMHLHHSMEIDTNEIVQKIITQQNRRMFQSSLLS